MRTLLALLLVALAGCSSVDAHRVHRPVKPANERFVRVRGGWVKVSPGKVVSIVDARLIAKLNELGLTSGGALAGVVGPASATDNAIMRFDTTTGKLAQNSAVTIDDAGAITITAGDITGLTNFGFTTVAKGGAGAVGAPTYSFTSDADTGIYNRTANELTFGTAGAERIRLSSGSIWFQAGGSGTAGGVVVRGANRLTAAVTSDATEGNSDSNLVYTNRGAVATVTRTLPATPPLGYHATYWRLATQTLRVDPGTTNAFRRADNTATTGGKYIELTTNGSMIELVWDGTEWLLITERGVLLMEV